MTEEHETHCLCYETRLRVGGGDLGNISFEVRAV